MILHYIVCRSWLDVSEDPAASISRVLALMLEAVSIFETFETYTRLHGAISLKAVVFILHAVRTLSPHKILIFFAFF
jgi:hypothetical protein